MLSQVYGTRQKETALLQVTNIHQSDSSVMTKDLHVNDRANSSIKKKETLQ